MYLRNPTGKDHSASAYLIWKQGRQSSQPIHPALSAENQNYGTATALSNTIGHILWECRVVSWEKHRLEQIYFNSQNDHLPARAQNKSLQLILFVCKIVINNPSLMLLCCKWEKEEKSIWKRTYHRRNLIDGTFLTMFLLTFSSLGKGETMIKGQQSAFIFSQYSM